VSVDTGLLIVTLHMAGYCDLDFLCSENFKLHIKIGCVCSKRMMQNKMHWCNG
jgi:hypothetical protein